jgi:hypothetical protein
MDEPDYVIWSENYFDSQLKVRNEFCAFSKSNNQVSYPIYHDGKIHVYVYRNCEVNVYTISDDCKLLYKFAQLDNFLPGWTYFDDECFHICQFIPHATYSDMEKCDRAYIHTVVDNKMRYFRIDDISQSSSKLIGIPVMLHINIISRDDMEVHYIGFGFYTLDNILYKDSIEILKYKHQHRLPIVWHDTIILHHDDTYAVVNIKWPHTIQYKTVQPNEWPLRLPPLSTNIEKRFNELVDLNLLDHSNYRIPLPHPLIKIIAGYMVE